MLTLSRKHLPHDGIIYVMFCSIILWMSFIYFYFFALPEYINLTPNYIHNPVLSALYILFFIVLVYLIFRKDLYLINHYEIARKKIIEIFLFQLGIILFSLSIPSEIANNDLYAQSAPFLSMHPNYVLVKSLEILLQQMFVVIFVYIGLLYSRKISITYLVFGIVFLFSHCVLVLFLPLWQAIVFSFGSFMACLAFPYILLNFKNGFLMTYVLHWLFYIVLFAIYQINIYA